MSTWALGLLRACLGSALFGTPKGRCRTLEFPLSVEPKSDPSHDVHVLPLLAWGQAARVGWAELR
eukprot:2934182-Pyramimonas_sp.AAC.1